MFAAARAHRLRDPPLPRRRRLRRGRDAGAAAALRRRAGAAVHDAPQRARPRPVPAHRHRAVPQAAHRRRARARVRDRQGLPQRGRVVQAQPRVHDARVVRGVRRLRGRDAAARRRSSRRRAAGARHDAWSSEGRDGRPRAALARACRSAGDRRAAGFDPLEGRATSPAARPRSRPTASTRAHDASWAELVDHMLSHYVEPHLVEPTFLVDYPVELSPLARRSARRPDAASSASRRSAAAWSSPTATPS